MKDKVSIKKENVMNAYHHATEEQKELLENMFGKGMFQPKNIMERVKTFEDAVAILGDKHILVKEYWNVVNHTIVLTKNLIAYLKLRIICAALNEGWKPKFDGEEYRNYPWFCIYTKKAYEWLSEDEKKECRVVGLSHGNAYSGSGVQTLSSGANSSSLIVLKTRELAEYCEKQFIDIWSDYLFV